MWLLFLEDKFISLPVHLIIYWCPLCAWHTVQRQRGKGKFFPEQTEKVRLRDEQFSLHPIASGYCVISSPEQGSKWKGMGGGGGGQGDTTGEETNALSPAGQFPWSPRAVGPRGAWGEGSPSFLLEACWKPAALRAPGASSAGVGPSRARGSRGGSARRPNPPRLCGVPRLPGVEALLSVSGWESNYYVEKDLILQHTPSLFLIQAGSSLRDSPCGTPSPRLHMHTYLHSGSPTLTRIHRGPYVQKYVCSQDNTGTPTQDSISIFMHSQDLTHYLCHPPTGTHPHADRLPLSHSKGFVWARIRHHLPVEAHTFRINNTPL